MKNHLGETIKKGSIVKSSALFKKLIEIAEDERKAAIEDGYDVEDTGYWTEFSGVPVKKIWGHRAVIIHNRGEDRVYPIFHIELDE